MQLENTDTSFFVLGHIHMHWISGFPKWLAAHSWHCLPPYPVSQGHWPVTWNLQKDGKLAYIYIMGFWATILIYLKRVTLSHRLLKEWPVWQLQGWHPNCPPRFQYPSSQWSQWMPTTPRWHGHCPVTSLHMQGRPSGHLVISVPCWSHEHSVHTETKT